VTTKFTTDQIYATPLAQLVDFSFDEKTVSVFPDMINRSVPGYGLMQSLTGLVATQKVRKKTKVYDLGCSLGASALSVLNSVGHSDYELTLIDQSYSMIEHCQQLFEQSETNVPILFLQQDIREVEINNASLVMLNLVLQFLPSTDRDPVINEIFTGLISNGALLLTEKIDTENDSEQILIDKLYTDFKKRSGYSELEINQKRKALENVMQVESIGKHHDRLINAGFSNVIPIMQALNFVSLLAIK